MTLAPCSSSRRTVGVPLKGKSVLEMGGAEFLARIVASPFEGKPAATAEEAKAIFAESWKGEYESRPLFPPFEFF